MKNVELACGSKVGSLEEASRRLRKGGKACVVNIDGVLKTYSDKREGYLREQYGEKNVHVVDGQA